MGSFNSFRVDLHTHSTFSDGACSVKELVAKAKLANISLLSLTDHDTVEGIPVARSLCRQAEIGFLSGVELSSQFNGGGCHILGYFVDEENEAFKQSLLRLKEARYKRNSKILVKLNSLGVDISEAELIESVPSSTVIGRPHIADLLVKKKYVASIKDAFKKFLGDHAPAYVNQEMLSPEEALKVILNSGGQPFLAHPVSLKLSLDKLMVFCKKLKDVGLSGIEVFNSAHDKQQTKKYLSIAKKLNLNVSGGSDFHGDLKPTVLIGQAFSGEYIMKDQIAEIFWQPKI